MNFKSCPQVETISDSKDRAFAIRRLSKPRFDFIWHHHPEVELAYIIRGYGVRYIGNSILPFHTGDLCLIGSGVPHAYGSHPKMRGKAQWLVIQFLPENFGEAFWKLPENRSFLRLLRAARRGIHFHRRETSRCIRHIEGLPKSGLAAFLQAFNELSRAKHFSLLNASAQEQERTDPRLQKVLAWLETEEPEAITQERAAKVAGMIPAAFSRFFRNQTGRVFVRHLNEMRVARACLGLSATDSPITEIALESGFRNLPNFNRRFREITGVTPTEYRRSLPGEI